MVALVGRIDLDGNREDWFAGHECLNALEMVQDLVRTEWLPFVDARARVSGGWTEKTYLVFRVRSGSCWSQCLVLTRQHR